MTLDFFLDTMPLEVLLLSDRLSKKGEETTESPHYRVKKDVMIESKRRPKGNLISPLRMSILQTSREEPASLGAEKFDNE